MRFSHYLFALFAFVVVALLEISAISSHKWIVFKTPSSSPLQLTSHYGLFQRCDRASLSFLESQSSNSDLGSWSFSNVGNHTTLLTSRSDSLPFRNSAVRDIKHEKRRQGGDDQGWRCRPFPKEEDCRNGDDDFCLAWKSSGYISLLSLIFLVSSSISTVFVLFLGGRIRRAKAWRVISLTLTGSVALQIISMALIANIFNNDERFYSGSKLSSGFFLQISSWTFSALIVGTLIGTGYHAEKVELHGALGGDGYRGLE